MRNMCGLWGLTLLLVACNAKPVDAPEATKTIAEATAPTAPSAAAAAAPATQEAPAAPQAPAPKEAAGEAPAPDAAAPKTPAGTTRIADVGFATPESVLFDPKSGGYFVSNINGSPLEKDDNGFISVLHHTGKVHDLKWVDGASSEVELHAPKGMGIAHGKLYVADLDVVRMFDVKSAEFLGNIPIEGATFLNDIAVGPDETVYVSDSGLKEGFEPSGTDAIYSINKANQIKTLIKDPSLGRPNGLLIAGNGVFVVTFGTGEMYAVGPDGVKSEPRRIGEGQLDGLVRLNGRDVAVSSWGSSAVLRGRPGGRFEPIVQGIKAPADLGYDTKRARLLIPLFEDNAVLIVPVPQ